ncbi:MAG: acyltransferase, partial [Gammaproteobacteria bacterium HGW-Gammaproteobacteria-14]
PKAGGAAFTLGAMAGHLKTLLDITIIYPRNTPRTLLAFLGGAIKDVEIIIQQHPIPDWVSQGDYEGDAEFRARFQQWVANLWADKDALLASRLDS